MNRRGLLAWLQGIFDVTLASKSTCDHTRGNTVKEAVKYDRSLVTCTRIEQ